MPAAVPYDIPQREHSTLDLNQSPNSLTPKERLSHLQYRSQSAHPQHPMRQQHKPYPIPSDPDSMLIDTDSDLDSPPPSPSLSARTSARSSLSSYAPISPNSPISTLFSAWPSSKSSLALQETQYLSQLPSPYGAFTSTAASMQHTSPTLSGSASPSLSDNSNGNLPPAQQRPSLNFNLPLAPSTAFAIQQQQHVQSQPTGGAQQGVLQRAASTSPSLLVSKPFRCPKPNCNKSFKIENGLKYHLTYGTCSSAPPKDLENVKDLLERMRMRREKEREGSVGEGARSVVSPTRADLVNLSESDLAEIQREAERRLRPIACGVGECTRRYKNMNGLRYHYQHSGEHGAIGLALLASGAHEGLGGKREGQGDGAGGQSGGYGVGGSRQGEEKGSASTNTSRAGGISAAPSQVEMPVPVQGQSQVQRSQQQMRTRYRSSSAPPSPSPDMLAARYGNGNGNGAHSNLWASSSPHASLATTDNTSPDPRPTPFLPRVRRGYWNRRGDHLTPDGYIVYSPLALAYPAELAEYPSEEVGYRNEEGLFLEYAEKPELSASLPLKGRAPERPYESFVVYVNSNLKGPSTTAPLPHGRTSPKRPSHKKRLTTINKELKDEAGPSKVDLPPVVDPWDLDTRLAMHRLKQPTSPTSSSSSYGSAHSVHSRASSFSGSASGHIPGTTRDVMEFPFGYPIS